MTLTRNLSGQYAAEGVLAFNFDISIADTAASANSRGVFNTVMARESHAGRMLCPNELAHHLAYLIDEAPRLRKLLLRAYRQFMPKAANVILICSSQAEEHEDFANALLGSHVARWDAFPPRGRRIAHGRAADGFWHGQRYPDSAVSGWFHLAPQEEPLGAKLWFREGLPIDECLRRTLDDLFGVPDDSAAPS